MQAPTSSGLAGALDRFDDFVALEATRADVGALRGALEEDADPLQVRVQRRFEATIECERWLPNDGFFPQIAQIFDIAGGIVATDALRPALARSRAKRSAISSAERTASAALVDPGLGLLDRVDRQDAEGDRHAGLDAGELQAGRALWAT